MSDDLISRQAAINTVFSMCCRWNTDDPNDLKNMLITAFQDLPSVDRKNGKWVPVPNTRLVNCECGFITDRLCKYNFCPNCGAEMEKGAYDE